MPWYQILAILIIIVIWFVLAPDFMIKWLIALLSIFKTIIGLVLLILIFAFYPIIRLIEFITGIRILSYNI